MPKYKVAIRCTSYNHSPYIKKTLEGVSSQVTNFKYVAIVIDDASTDGTQDVIKQYIDNYYIAPEDGSQNYRETGDAFIYYMQHRENKNCYIAAILLKYNYYQIKKSKEPIMSEWIDDADYWALCECDDYWIYDKKLQEEVDILDAHPEYGLIYTDYDINHYETGEYEKAAFKNGKKSIIRSFEQHLINKAYIAPMSWLCRKPLRELLNGYQGPDSIDTTFIIALEIFLQSKVYFLNKVTCVYGTHMGSATKQTSYSKQYQYAHGVYLTQKYYLEKYGLRDKYPECLDYFIHAYYTYILAQKKTDEYPEVQSYFYRKRKSSFKFLILDLLMRSKICLPILQFVCKKRLSKNS